MSFVTFETISLDNKKAIKNKLKGGEVKKNFSEVEEEGSKE